MYVSAVPAYSHFIMHGRGFSMSESIYKIQMKTPMGIKKGAAEVCLRDRHMVLELLGSENQFTGSFVPEYAFRMDGILRTAVRELPGRLQGVLWEDGFRAVLHTEQGDFPIEGVLDHSAEKNL